MNDATPEQLRFQAAEANRDQLQGGLDRREALERRDGTGHVSTAERQRLDEAIDAADQEVTDAEIAFYRAEGDHEHADHLEVDRLERHLIASRSRKAHRSGTR